MLTILNVAYPHAAVGPDATGGAEQVLHAVESATARAGHRSIVIACEGSRVAGELIATPAERGPVDAAARERAQRIHRETIGAVLATRDVDLVHMHGVDFHCYLPPPGVPVLATLHLPADWYPPAALRPLRPRTWIHCVSAYAHSTCPESPALLAPVENGVPVDALTARRYAKRGFAVCLGRICPEKGTHLAIEAARIAGRPLLVAGEVYRYEAHLAYFRDEVEPRLDGARRYVGSAGFRAKRRLLSSACCLLVPSLVAETSSLVAREALACGTPVIAFANGALRETVDEGRTGFLVGDAQGMAAAMHRLAQIDAETCRRTARDRFALEVMTNRYLQLYEQLAQRRP